MYQKVFPAELDFLYEMLEFIKTYGEKHGLAGKGLDHIQLAAEEALVNIINYGYPDKKKGSIDIICSSTLSKPGVRVILQDQGVPFNPIEKAPKALPIAAKLLEEGESSLGGYGIYILMGLMDKVEYKRLENGNKLILTKYL